MNKLYLGIDPGWKNLGWGLTDESGAYVASGRLNPSEHRVGSMATVLLDSLPVPREQLAGMMMERYVVYKGQYNPDSEHILLVTGQLQSISAFLDIPLTMFRAVDWKERILKYIYLEYKKENPSNRMDKEFSFFAAETLTGFKPETDHEADGLCLSWFAGAIRNGAKGRR